MHLDASCSEKESSNNPIGYVRKDTKVLLLKDFVFLCKVQ